MKTTIEGLPLLEYLTKPPPTSWSEPVRTPIYQLEAYLDLRERHSREHGLEFDRDAYVASISWPEEKPRETVKEKKVKTPIDVTDPCKVYVQISYRRDKSVKVELLTGLLDLYQQYYSKGQQPPFAKVLRVYRKHGYGKEILDEYARRHEINRTTRSETAEKLIARVFPDKKPGVKKKVSQQEVSAANDECSELGDESDESDGEDTWEDDEDNAFDMEIDDNDEDAVDEDGIDDEPQEDFVDEQ